MREGGVQLGIIIILISASSSSQSIVLLMQASYPAYSDPIPTRSVSETRFKANTVSEMKRNGARAQGNTIRFRYFLDV